MNKRFIFPLHFIIIISIRFLQGGTIMKVTKESIIGDVLDQAPGTAQFFFEIGMHCLGCPSARGESIADACMVHGTDCNDLLIKLNNYFNGK